MRTLVLGALLLMSAGCVTRQVSGSRGAASVAPALSVETFLEAANRRDLETMARIFGTGDGPIGDTGSTFGCAFKKMGSWIGLGDRCLTRPEVEVRMNLIADVLASQRYQLGADERVAGRERPTTRLQVTLTKEGREVEGIPFVVVQGGSGSWYIEEIGLDRVTASR
ncbi:MAG: hypothetical protein R3E98_03345 [Gemmatimonadota bacterium]